LNRNHSAVALDSVWSWCHYLLEEMCVALSRAKKLKKRWKQILQRRVNYKKNKLQKLLILM